MWINNGAVKMKETELKILYLTLEREPFIEILEGRKKAEFRRDCPHWRSRLLNKDGSIKKFDIVQFTNGYNNQCPAMRVEWKGLSCSGQFIIHLGEILETWKTSKLQ